MRTRAAAVAGYFYDANPGRLKHDVNQLLGSNSVTSEAFPEALIVPHAGYVYSGSTAACAYRQLLVDPDQVTRVLLLGPAHRVYVEGMAIPSVDRFATPLGEIMLDREGLSQIGTLPAVRVNDEAHREEHSLEVQLPFLQTVLNDFSLIPVVIGGASAAQVAAVIDALAGAEPMLVVVSSDLSHFLDYEEAQRIDADTCDLILNKATSLRGEQACGAAAINGLMASAWSRKLSVSLLQACNSGDTAGQRDRVVGYAAFSLH
jgi:AmmeMemoRadiSam system protein B